eukprot:scaffold1834_cov175-Amphora_coffeaeformis.AAC.7
MAWGSSSLRSCTLLWEKVERNDPSLVDLYILPTKSVTEADWERCIQALQRHGRERSLVSIHASGHAIDVESLRQFSQALYKTSQDVGWNEIAIGDSNLGDDGLTALVDSFAKDFRLASLDLSYKSLSSKGLQSVLEWSRSSDFLKKLDLSRNFDLVKGFLPDDFPAREGSNSFPALEEANLSDCNIQGEAGVLVISCLASAPRLQLLRLSHNPLGSSIVDSLTGVSPCLVELSLAKCGLIDEHFQNLVPSLSKLEHLQTLDISQNALTKSGVVALANGMADGFSVLNSIHLAGNPLLATGVISFVEQLGQQRQTTLSFLDLSSTQCSAEAARLVIKSLDTRQLRLFDNALGSEGFRLLADTLRGGHPTIKSLDVAGNGANQESVVELLQGLLVKEAGFNSVLETLVVGGNQGGQSLEGLIQQIKEIRPGLDIARDRIRKTS